MDITTNPTYENALCKSCFTKVNEDDQFCNSCGYPLKGTEQEQRNFTSEKYVKEISLDGAQKQIQRASYALYFIAGATAFSGLIAYATTKDIEVKNDLLIVNGILAVIYTALGFWCKKKPLAAIIAGSSLYVLVFILNAVTNPLTIVSGIIFKIFIVIYFIRGIKSAFEAEKLKKELNIE